MDERPGLYVRLEVGVSWPRHFTKRRSVSYTSGAIKSRDQQLALPAHAHASTSAAPPDHRPWPQPTQQYNQHLDPEQAYLRHVYNYAAQSNHLSEQPYWHQQHTAPDRHIASRPAPIPLASTANSHDHYVPYHPSHRQQPLYYSYADHLPRRSRSMSSHNGRGSSVPPPTHDRPWDAEPEPMTSTALPPRKTTSRPRPQTWKPLPATPSHFRLGEEEMPWSGSPDPAAYSAVEVSRRGQAEASPNLSSRTSPPRSVDDRERGRTVEMQSLATALMTVDNGFEDQWWYQGPRILTMAGDLIPPAPLRDMYSYDHALEPREYATSPSGRHFQPSTPTSTIVDLVSPLSGFSSPASRQSHIET